MWYTILVTLVVDVGGLFLLYVLLRDRVRRATSAAAQIAEIREEVSRLLVELNQTTDRNIAVMEDRINSLNGLLGVADKKIGLLQREIEKHDVGTRIYSRLADAREENPRLRQERKDAAAGLVAAAGSAAQPLAVELSDRPDRPAREENPQLRQERKTSPSTVKGTAARTGDSPDLHERVMLLHRSGFSAPLIAGQVGAPLGEVELIISLERRKGRA